MMDLRKIWNWFKEIDAFYSIIHWPIWTKAIALLSLVGLNQIRIYFRKRIHMDVFSEVIFGLFAFVSVFWIINFFVEKNKKETPVVDSLSASSSGRICQRCSEDKTKNGGQYKLIKNMVHPWGYATGKCPNCGTFYDFLTGQIIVQKK